MDKILFCPFISPGDGTKNYLVKHGHYDCRTGVNCAFVKSPHLSSSISRLDSDSDRCLHRASRLSVSICNFLCSLRFSSFTCFSSSINAAIFLESEKHSSQKHVNIILKMQFWTGIPINSPSSQNLSIP